MNVPIRNDLLQVIGQQLPSNIDPGRQNKPTAHQHVVVVVVLTVNAAAVL